MRRSRVSRGAGRRDADQHPVPRMFGWGAFRPGCSARDWPRAAATAASGARSGDRERQRSAPAGGTVASSDGRDRAGDPGRGARRQRRRSGSPSSPGDRRFRRAFSAGGADDEVYRLEPCGTALRGAGPRSRIESCRRARAGRPRRCWGRSVGGAFEAAADMQSSLGPTAAARTLRGDVLALLRRWSRTPVECVAAKLTLDEIGRRPAGGVAGHGDVRRLTTAAGSRHLRLRSRGPGRGS